MSLIGLSLRLGVVYTELLNVPMSVLQEYVIFQQYINGKDEEKTESPQDVSNQIMEFFKRES